MTHHLLIFLPHLCYFRFFSSIKSKGKIIVFSTGNEEHGVHRPTLMHLGKIRFDQLFTWLVSVKRCCVSCASCFRRPLNFPELLETWEQSQVQHSAYFILGRLLPGKCGVPILIAQQWKICHGRLAVCQQGKCSAFGNDCCIFFPLEVEQENNKIPKWHTHWLKNRYFLNGMQVIAF